MTSFYDQFFAEPMAERQRIAEAAGLSLAYILKHTYVQHREPRFHFHNAIGLDRASNGKLCFLDTTEGDVDWPYVLRRLKELQRTGRIGRSRPLLLATTHFEKFWQLYPRKVNKPGALAAWHRQCCDTTVQEVCLHLRQQAGSADWQKEGGKFIPHPTTYLNQRRWEELIQLPGAPASVFAGVQ